MYQDILRQNNSQKQTLLNLQLYHQWFPDNLGNNETTDDDKIGLQIFKKSLSQSLTTLSNAKKMKVASLLIISGCPIVYTRRASNCAVYTSFVEEALYSNSLRCYNTIKSFHYSIMILGTHSKSNALTTGISLHLFHSTYFTKRISPHVFHYMYITANYRPTT